MNSTISATNPKVPFSFILFFGFFVWASLDLPSGSDLYLIPTVFSFSSFFFPLTNDTIAVVVVAVAIGTMSVAMACHCR